jgi:hypothetical protein
VSVGVNVFSQGCYTKLQPHTVEMVDALGGLAFTVAGFEVARRIVFSLDLALIQFYYYQLIAGVAALLLAGSYKNKRKSSISS